MHPCVLALFLHPPAVLNLLLVDFKPGPAQLLLFSVPNTAFFKFPIKFHPKVALTSAGQPVLLATAGKVPSALKSWTGMVLPWLFQGKLKICPS